MKQFKNATQTASLKKLLLVLILIKIALIFMIPSINIFNFEGRALLGADGKAYVLGASQLLKDGIFSKDEILNFFPAGYSILIYFVGLLFGVQNTLTLISILQVIVYGLSILKSINLGAKNNLFKYRNLFVFLLLFNPILNTATYTLGYESLAASSFIFIFFELFEIISNQKLNSNSISKIFITLGFISSLQPRFSLTCFILILIILKLKVGANQSKIKIIALAIVLFFMFPTFLIFRNHVATGINSISLNLGATMNVGAGLLATGAYNPNFDGVPCRVTEKTRIRPGIDRRTVPDKQREKTDQQQIVCVLKWYLENPTEYLRLSVSKAQYWWTPYADPRNKSTLQGNLWINFIKSLNSSTKLSGYVSTFWEILTVSLMSLGFRYLFKLNKRYFYALCSFILINLLMTTFTIGDNRFRVPLTGVILFVQAIALYEIISFANAQFYNYRYRRNIANIRRN